MNKDVIYIDVEDDVTAIIGKIRDAKEKVVALVPPKRSGALQSAVNLRLLQRMAKASKKQLVLVTSNQALVALAASANIPVAKNLQSKPELAEIPALIIDDGDDIIDGADLPVGELARTTAATKAVSSGKSTVPEKDTMRHQAIDEITYSDIDDGDDFVQPAVATPRVAAGKAAKPVKSKNSSSKKVPSFDSFRKKLVLITVGLGAVTALLVWMFVFAPAATVIITARTSPQPVSSQVRLGDTAATDFKAGVISSVSRQDKKEISVDFEATGQKDLGEKATGSIRFSTSSLGGLGTIPAGTKLTSSSGLVFITDNSVTLAYQGGTSSSGTTTVTAADSGENYNAATGSLSGAPANVSAAFTGPTSGGTTKVVKVVSVDDIERAKGQVAGKSSDEEKKALVKKFTNGEIVIDSSFVVDRAEPVIAPAVGAEAPDGKAKLTVSTTYTIQAVAKTELQAYLKSAIESKIDTATQKIYNTGVDGASLGSFRKDGETTTVAVSAAASVGPKIDEDAIKEQVGGKRYGEVQQSLQLIEGVKDVDVQFKYFWVRTVPNNTDKIIIEFKVEDE